MDVFVQPGIELKHFEAISLHMRDKHPAERFILHNSDAGAWYAAERIWSTTGFYIGGTLIPYSGPGTRYFEGMLNDAWRWDSILACEGMARILYSNMWGNHQGWYLTEEADVSSLVHSGLKNAVTYYNIELIKRLHAIKPLPFIWSPWASGAYSSARAQAYRDVVWTIHTWLKSQYGITVDLTVHLQDGVGAGFHTIAEAARWGLELKKVTPPGVKFAMNVEHFGGSGGNWTHRDASAAVAQYKANGLPIGSAWEARYWYPNVGYVANHAH